LTVKQLKNERRLNTMNHSSRIFLLRIVSSAALVCCIMLAGCAVVVPAANTGDDLPGAQLSGKVHGGQYPSTTPR